MSELLLSINKLSLAFPAKQAALPPKEVLKQVSLTLNKGETLAVVGESGSGKSLTALSCLGLQPHNALIQGSIHFNGQELIGATDEHLQKVRGKHIGMVFQEPMTALNPLHTIGQQIKEMLDIHQQMTRAQAIARVQELLDSVGLSHFKDRLDAYPHQLSGGERQRVMIAMAMANNPELLIADEPTTAVDVTIQLKILKLLKQLQAKTDMGILFITHDLTIVRHFADRVAVMSQGEVVEIGNVEDVFSNPKHSYTQHLLSSEPKGPPVALPAKPVNVLACEHLKVHFPILKGLFRRTAGYVKAVDHISITVPKGSTLGVVGESGSGKSTLAFAILRLIKSEGRIAFLGRDIHQLNSEPLQRLRRQMQIVFQDPYSSLNPRMNVCQIIEEGLRVHFPHKDEAERLRDVDDILLEVGLTPDMKDRYPHEFSGGQRQRISIARAMVLKPDFVVLDEPTSALDLSIQAQIIDLLKKLQEKYGLSTMFISHDLRVVKAIAHRVIVMHKGVIVEQGDTQTIFEKPQHEYTRSLIEAAFMVKVPQG
jgi:microcin C transport system ATP-binding protein